MSSQEGFEKRVRTLVRLVKKGGENPENIGESAILRIAEEFGMEPKEVMDEIVRHFNSA